MAHLNISPDFFKMEEREGFPVGELMKRNWAAQLQVLEDVRELCEKHDIKWFAYSGTLLGAVRHKGFIPWDDDIDICMVGEDFIKFLYYVKDELDEKYIHLSPYDRGDWEQRTIFRIANSDCMEFGKSRMDEWFNCPLAIGTDVFPFYYVPREKKKADYIVDLLTNIEYLYQLNDYSIKHLRMGDTEAAKAQEDLIAATIIGLQQETGFTFTADRPLANQLCMLYDQVCRFTVEEEADYVTRYSAYINNKDFVFPKELFYEQVSLPFEMLTLPSPKDYDFFLKKQYGENYMKPKMGAAHDYPYFAKQIRVLDTKLEVYDWASKQGDTEHIKCETPKKQKLSDSQNEKCVVLYYTSIREMIIYSEYVIDKIRDMIRYFKEHSDTVSLYWCPGGFVDAEKLPNLPSADRIIPELKEEYYRLIEEFKGLGIGICDESGDLNKAIDSCDFYYGDEGLLQKLFASTGKPVYIQDYHSRWNEESKNESGQAIDLTFIAKPSGIFEGDIKPKFDDAVYVSGDTAYAMASNMNGLFKIDRKEGTYEFLHFIKGEAGNGVNLYAKAIPFGEKIVFIPQSANNLVIYDPKMNVYKEINVYVDIMNPWCDKAKYADCVEYEGKLFLFGERYNFVMKIDPETGEKKLFDDNQTDIVWMRHAAFREGGLVRIISAVSKDILTFNLRKEQLFVQKSYSEAKVMPKLKELAAEKEKRMIDSDSLNLVGNYDKYCNYSFEGFDTGSGMLIKEKDEWISFEDVVKYVNWKKSGRI